MSVAARPLVSVITPTFNQRAFIEATLRSVRAQTWPAVEHVVVDGGSTDGTLDVLRREGDAGRIRWMSEPDEGMYDAVNKGLAMASGEILAYLNSDDAYFPWTLETVVDAFGAMPTADLVFGDGIKVDEVTGVQRLRLFPPYERSSLANFESLMQPAVFWRRRVIDRLGGFDTTMRYVGDLDYWLRAGAAGLRVEHVDEVIAIERIHGARLSDAHRERMAIEDRAMRTKHAGADPATGGRRTARRRHKAWQRWLWLRFLGAYLLGRPAGPWSRFRREGDLSVRRLRVIAGLLPRGRDRFWPDAVHSRVAGAILALEGD